MARFVVETNDLEALFERWRSILTNHCGQARQWTEANDMVHIEWDRPYVPEGEDPTYVFFQRANRERRNPFFRHKKGLFDSLQDGKWGRICWFYYCDDAFGNTIRLYDTEHFEWGLNRSVYLELEANGQWLGRPQRYDDRVLIRGENIEFAGKPLKKSLKGCFSKSASARSAPFVERGGRIDLEGMCEIFFAKRSHISSNKGGTRCPEIPSGWSARSSVKGSRVARRVACLPGRGSLRPC